jgi:ABC-2 type transport system ATP-binding protein
VGAILETRNLTKYYRSDWTYRRTLVLDSLSLSIEEGEIFGLLGPNGAGKTTTFKLVLGFLRASHGEVLFRGAPITPPDRSEIGFLPEQPYFYDYLSVQEALSLFANLYGIKGSIGRSRINEIMERLHLTGKRRAALRTLSKGMLQRVGVAQAILARPKLVILDEPMSGLDPTGRHDMRELISDLQSDGTSVILSSHILPDVEALCDRVAILVNGGLRETITLAANDDVAAYDLQIAEADSTLLEKLTTLVGEPPVRNNELWQLRVPSRTVANQVLDLIRQENGSVETLTPKNISLEQRFLSHVDDQAHSQ